MVTGMPQIESTRNAKLEDLEATAQAYKDVPPVSSWPSTSASTGPPSSTGLDCEATVAESQTKLHLEMAAQHLKDSNFASQIEQVLFHLCPKAPTLSPEPAGFTAATPIPLPRTRISSQAKPFVPSGTAVPTTSMTALPRTRISSLAKPFVPGVSIGTRGAAYSEQAQEAVYLQAASASTANNTAYDESLQEELYLKARVPSRTPSPERFHWASTPPITNAPIIQEAPGSQTRRPQEAPGSQTRQPQTSFAWTDDRMPLSRIAMKGLGLARSSAVTGAVGQQLQQQQQQQDQQRGQQQQDGLLSVKHTFIHYEDPENQSSTDRNVSAARRRSASAPGTLVTRWLQLSDKAAIHQSGQCRPCAYFYYKEDGCRQAADCRFCHMCPIGEIKRRKKEKREQKKLFKTKDENVEPLPAPTLVWSTERPSFQV